MWLPVLFTLVISYFIYYFCLKPYNYWKNRGIIYEIPLPLVGNFGSTILRRTHVSEINNYLYKKYSKKRYVGIYIFSKPALLLRDINLIKKICVGEFEHFSDRVRFFHKDFDTVRGNVLTNLTGKEWKETRRLLNPAFSIPQIKIVFDLISDCAKNFGSHFSKENRDLIEIQLYEVFSKFESDVISSVCFGLKNDSLEDTENLFYKMHQKLKSFGVLEQIKLFLIQLCPVIAKILQIHVIPTKKTDFFKRLLLETLQRRRSENTIRHDFVHYLLETKKGTFKQKEDSVGFTAVGEPISVKPEENQKTEWTDEEIVLQTFIFFYAHSGMETLITASSFLAYELALNPVIQVKLQEEIDNVLQNSFNNKVSYEDILKMKYLDCVVSECLRKWPPVYQIDRQCVKNFFEVELSVPDDEKIVIEKGTTIIIPVMAIHRDPNYFPSPEKFSPERFSTENKEDIVSGSYIPYGYGPRCCIGYKLAILEIKLLFFYLLSKFDVVPTENTKTHLLKNPFSLDMHSATSTFLGLKTRKVTSL